MKIERFNQAQEESRILRKTPEPTEPTLEVDYSIVPKQEVKIEFSPESSVKLVQEKLESRLSEDVPTLLQEIHPEDFEAFKQIVNRYLLEPRYANLVKVFLPMLENNTGNPNTTRKDSKELRRSFSVFASTFYKYLNSITAQEILGDDVDSDELTRERLGAVKNVMNRMSDIGFFDITEEFFRRLQDKLV